MRTFYQYRYFFLLETRNQTVMAAEIPSATTIEAQIPSILKKTGRISTAAAWNTRQRINEIRAEVNPSFSAVKKDEP